MVLEKFDDFNYQIIAKDKNNYENIPLGAIDKYEYYGNHKDILLVVGDCELGNIFMAIDTSVGKQDYYNILTYTIGNKNKVLDAYNDYKEKYGWILENKKGVNRMKKEDFKDLVSDYGMDFIEEKEYDYAPQYMDDLYYFGENEKGFWKLMDKIFYGSDYNNKQHNKFNPECDYFFFDRLDNLYSLDEYYLTDYIVDLITNMGDEEDFISWCAEQGYIDIEDYQ